MPWWVVCTSSEDFLAIHKLLTSLSKPVKKIAYNVAVTAPACTRDAILALCHAPWSCYGLWIWRWSSLTVQPCFCGNFEPRFSFQLSCSLQLVSWNLKASNFSCCSKQKCNRPSVGFDRWHFFIKNYYSELRLGIFTNIQLLALAAASIWFLAISQPSLWKRCKQFFLTGY
jgi:hypothetical protein